VSEFVLFNKAVIFVFLFGKTAKLLHAPVLVWVTWVEVVLCLQKDKT